MMPEEAVEAAMDVVLDDGLVLKRSLVHDLLEAAAPHMLSEAWDEGYFAAVLQAKIDRPARNPYWRADD